MTRSRDSAETSSDKAATAASRDGDHPRKDWHDGIARLESIPAKLGETEVRYRNIIESTLHNRALRARHFPRCVAAEPAWSLMLELIAADLRRDTISVARLCQSLPISQATALRHIGRMCECDIAMRWQDPIDHRRTNICISAAGRQAMLRYLSAAR